MNDVYPYNLSTRQSGACIAAVKTLLSTVLVTDIVCALNQIKNKVQNKYGNLNKFLINQKKIFNMFAHQHKHTRIEQEKQSSFTKIIYSGNIENTYICVKNSKIIVTSF